LPTIADYYLEAGVKIDSKSLQKVDQMLKTLERKLKALNSGLAGLEIAKFKVDDKALKRVLGDALDEASRSVTFEITKFDVNQQSLRKSLMAATQRASKEVSSTVRVNANVNAREARHSGGGYNSGVRGALFDAALTGGLAFGGLGFFNERNQELQSSQIALQSILGQQQGQQSYDWLREQANRVGFDYRQSLPQFTGFLASASPLMGVEASQQLFQAISEFGLTRGATTESQGRAFYAIQQIASKGKVSSEELNQQLSEAMGFGESRSIFAQAFQMAQGGNLTGKEADNALREAMKKGNVQFSELAPFLTQIFSQRAAPGIAAASQSSRAQAGRLQNAFNDQVSLAGINGLEEGFARLFKSLAEGLQRTDDLTKSLANTFNASTYAFSAVVDLFTDLAVDGLPKLADALGVSESALLAAGGAAAFAMLPFGKLALAIAGIALAVDDLQGFMEGKDSLIGRFLDDEQEEKLRNFLTSLPTLLNNTLQAVSDLRQGFLDLFTTLGDASFIDIFLTNMMKISTTLNEVMQAVSAVKNGEWGQALEHVKNLASLSLDGPATKFLTDGEDSLYARNNGGVSLWEEMEARRQSLFGQFDTGSQNFKDVQEAMRLPMVDEPLGALTLNGPMTSGGDLGKYAGLNFRDMKLMFDGYDPTTAPQGPANTQTTNNTTNQFNTTIQIDGNTMMNSDLESMAGDLVNRMHSQMANQFMLSFPTTE